MRKTIQSSAYSPSLLLNNFAFFYDMRRDLSLFSLLPFIWSAEGKTNTKLLECFLWKLFINQRQRPGLCVNFCLYTICSCRVRILLTRTYHSLHWEASVHVKIKNTVGSVYRTDRFVITFFFPKFSVMSLLLLLPIKKLSDFSAHEWNKHPMEKSRIKQSQHRSKQP